MYTTVYISGINFKMCYIYHITLRLVLEQRLQLYGSGGLIPDTPGINNKQIDLKFIDETTIAFSEFPSQSIYIKSECN